MMQTEPKKSRAEYFRQRRKNHPERLEHAKGDAARKREMRGGPKDPLKQYKKWLQSLPPEERAFAIEFNIDSRDAHGIFQPITELIRKLKDGLSQASAAIHSNDLPEVKSKKKFGSLSMSPGAQARRIEELRYHFDREICAAFERPNSEEITSWAKSQFPESFEEVLRSIFQQYDEARARVISRKNDNAKRQAKYRKDNIDRVRSTEKEKTRLKRAREKEARQRAPFVAIDAEGCDIGDQFLIEGPDKCLFLDLGLPERHSENARLKGQDHRTFLWGAGDDKGRSDWLVNRDKRPLASREICDWLVSLPEKFPHGIFVMFAAGYDWTQIFRDMDYETAWEVWHGRPWAEREDAGKKPNRRRYALWGEFAVRLYPGKYLEIGKFRDRNRIRNQKNEYDFMAKIKIYDTFGFFQASFLKAATGFGGDFLSQDEREILEGGKARRNEFDTLPLGEIRNYTAVELRVLSRMMEKLRGGLRGYDLTLRDWHGAGCIAQAMMKKDKIREFYPELTAEIDVDDLSSQEALSLRALFGGRVEMIKQGVTNRKFLNYDISSAYPDILRRLPNMRNGKWRVHKDAELLTRLRVQKRAEQKVSSADASERSHVLGIQRKNLRRSRSLSVQPRCAVSALPVFPME